MDTGSTCDANGIDVAKTTNFALQLRTCDLYAVCGLFRCILDCEVYMKSNLDLEIQNSIPTVNKWLVLVTAEHENNKERTHHNASHQYPANPSPYGCRVYLGMMAGDHFPPKKPSSKSILRTSRSTSRTKQWRRTSCCSPAVHLGCRSN